MNQPQKLSKRQARIAAAKARDPLITAVMRDHERSHKWRFRPSRGRARLADLAAIGYRLTSRLRREVSNR